MFQHDERIGRYGQPLTAGGGFPAARDPERQAKHHADEEVETPYERARAAEDRESVIESR